MTAATVVRLRPPGLPVSAIKTGLTGLPLTLPSPKARRQRRRLPGMPTAQCRGPPWREGDQYRQQLLGRPRSQRHLAAAVEPRQRQCRGLETELEREGEEEARGLRIPLGQIPCLVRTGAACVPKPAPQCRIQVYAMTGERFGMVSHLLRHFPSTTLSWPSPTVCRLPFEVWCSMNAGKDGGGGSGGSGGSGTSASSRFLQMKSQGQAAMMPPGLDFAEPGFSHMAFLDLTSQVS